jgi:hypothetical protein
MTVVLRSMFDAVEAAFCLLDEKGKEVAELVENISAIIPTAMSIINENSWKIGGGPRVSYYSLSDDEARGQNDHHLCCKFEKGFARVGGEPLTFDEFAAARKCLERLGEEGPTTAEALFFLFVDITTGLQT